MRTRQLSLLFILFFSPLGLAKSVNLAEFTEQATIPQIHQKMQTGTITSEMLVRFYLDRIKTIDDNGPKLNAVVQLNPNALAQAKKYDQLLKKSGPVGILHGIPVLLKDNIDTTDNMANTAGSLALVNNFPKKDAFIVQQLKQAGAIILGKTNLSEWANFRGDMATSGWSSLYGQTKNPYDVTRNPCGSSSGSGAAIAANLATVAIGTETDGSITCPAAVNGIVGIKPTIGTVSRHGIIPIAFSQDTAGPMARNVTDAAITLAAMLGYDHQDPAPVKLTINTDKRLNQANLSGKRIGVVRQLSGYHKSVDKLFEQAIDALRQQGAIIIDDLAFSENSNWGEYEYQVLLYEFKDGINTYLQTTPNNVPKSLAELIAFNTKHDDKVMPYFKQEVFLSAQEKGSLTTLEYKNALKQAKNMSQQSIDNLLAEHQLDLLIAPSTGPAWKTDLINGDNFSGSASSPAAVSGYPHITVPMGYIKGLPVGLSLFSHQLSEETLIAAALAYEHSTKHRKPPKLAN